MWSIWLPDIIVSLVFAVGLGFAAREDDNFVIWKPIVLGIGLFFACFLLGKINPKLPGNPTVNWVALNVILFAMAAVLVKFILTTKWPQAVATGVMFVLIENGFVILYSHFLYT